MWHSIARALVRSSPWSKITRSSAEMAAAEDSSIT
jgi:hypothetical protein